MQFKKYILVGTTSLFFQKKRREKESFLDWFSRRTNFELLGYTSSHLEDILRAFSMKRGVDTRLKDHEAMK